MHFSIDLTYQNKFIYGRFFNKFKNLKIQNENVQNCHDLFRYETK